MPNYKKVSHISPLFKKPNIEKEFLKGMDVKDDNSNGNKSNFMDDIKNAI